MDIEELRAKAKEAGIKSYWNKKPEKILAEMGFNMEKEPLKMRPMLGKSKEFELIIDQGQDYLKRIGFDKSELIQRAQDMTADKAVYSHKYRTFQLYKNNKHFDNLSINSF